jgi:ABC-type glycerol-3-phosphate transport system substrate-binding protein
VKFDQHYNKATLAPFTAPNGDIIGAPLFLYVISLWNNQDLLSEHGLSAPETWDDLLNTCRTLSAAGVTPIALGNRGTDAWTSALWMDTLLYQFGGAEFPVNATFGNAAKTWDDPAVAQAATRYKELVDAKCFPKGFAGLTYAQMQALFTRGDAALSLDGSWFAQEFGKGGGEFEVGVSPVPDAPEAASSTGSLQGIIGGTEGLAASAKAGKEKPALLAAFLDAVAANVDEYANSQSALSVAASPQPAGNALQKTLSQQLEQVQELTLSTDLRVPSALHDDFYQSIQGLLAGKVPPDEFGAGMAEAVKREEPNFEKVQ